MLCTMAQSFTLACSSALRLLLVLENRNFVRRYSALNMSDAWAILAKDTYKGVISGMVYGPHTVCIMCVPRPSTSIDLCFIGCFFTRFCRFHACCLRHKDLSRRVSHYILPVCPMLHMYLVTGHKLTREHV